MRSERSIFWPVTIVAGAFLVLLGLGTWQVERLFWKEALIAERQVAVTATPIPPPRSLAQAKGLDFHRLVARGRFRHDHELYLGASDDAGHLGYHVITPLALDDGGVLLVDRGFVPSKKGAPAPHDEAAGEVTVTGLLRIPPEGRPAWFLPDNDPVKNYWFYVDIPAMAAAARQENVLPYSMDADATPNPGGLPIGGQTPLDLPNNHLQYAITWYALAAALVVIATLRIRQHRAEGGAA